MTARHALRRCAVWFGVGLISICGLQGQQPAAHLSASQQWLPLPGYDQNFPFSEQPYGIAVDQSGNLFVTDEDSGVITEVERIADSTYFSYTAWTAPNAYGIAIDKQHNLYITQAGTTNAVLKASVTAIPGFYSNTTLPISGLGQPAGIAVDPSGNLYITDILKNQVIKMAPVGNGYRQSILPTSPLSTPYGVAVDASGNVFIADYGHNRLLKETPSSAGYTESVLPNSQGSNPFGVSVDANGVVYVINFSSQVDAVSLVRDTPSPSGYVLSTVPTAPGRDYYAIAVDGYGVYLAAPGENQLARLLPSAPDFGKLYVGSPGLPVTLLFAFDQAGAIGAPSVTTGGNSGSDFSNAGTGSCGKSSLNYHVGDICTVDVSFKPTNVGGRYGSVVLKDIIGNRIATDFVYGQGSAPLIGFLPGIPRTLDSTLAHPLGLALDVSGSVYVTESRTGKVYRESSSVGGRQTIAQGIDTPSAVALDGAGNLYIAAAQGVYKETLVGTGYVQSSIAVGPDDLNGIAADGAANLYLISASSGNVHKETRGPNGAYVETAIGSGIANPTGIAVDGTGNIFVADARQGTVYEEALGPYGVYLQTAILTGLNSPQGVAVDSANHLWVTVSGDNVVNEYELRPGLSPLLRFTFATPASPAGIAVDQRKNMYVTQDAGNGTLTKIDVATPPSGLTFPNTRVGAISPVQQINLANVGDSTLEILGFQGTNGSTISTGFEEYYWTTCPGDDQAGYFANTSCVFSIAFAPKQHVNYSGSLDIASDNLNAEYARLSIPLSGLGVSSDTSRTTLRVSPNPVKSGLGVTVTVTVSDTANPAIIPTGAISLTDTVGTTLTSLNGGNPLPLTAGKAVLSFTAGTPGTHTISAHYNGVDASFSGSTGDATLTVNQ